MLLAPLTERAVPQASDLDAIRDLYARGLFLQAYHRAVALAPLQDWRGPAARVLAGRLAMNLGAPRLAMGHFLLARREDPADPEAAYYYARTLLDRKGPLAAWSFLQRTGALPAAPPSIHSDWLALHGHILGLFRDFDVAETWLRRAEEACPGQPWTQVEWSRLYELEDRYEEALAAARRSLELHPWYRPGVGAVAGVLQLLDRDREALELLVEADKHLENAPVVALLATLQKELGLHADARASLARFAQLTPLREKELDQWLSARRSDTACFCGDYAEAAAFARCVGDPFYEALAERLTHAPDEGKRVQLDVGFVRQHHQTCVPATLAALTRYWGKPADHQEVAAAICYDGTPNHRERHWAEERGWVCRDFTLTWESAVALLDRGVPFVLDLAEPTSAHEQAVIGYDSRRRTLLIRDPFLRCAGEFVVDSLLERCRSQGPRAMALVPRERAELLDGLELPDASLYDCIYRLQRCLEAHQREAAAEVYAELQRQAPGHRLTLYARRILAGYDVDVTEMLASVQGLLQLFPGDAVLELAELQYLRELTRRDERLERLRAICARPHADPVFWRTYARELADDARAHATALGFLRRAIRARPTDAVAFLQMAHILWDGGRFDEALEIYRFAACLEDKEEGYARSYFAAARCLRQTETALRLLERRFERFGSRSSQPARTLYWAYSQCERSPEALAVLDRARQLRPEDGELLLFAADMYTGHGDFERAAACLAAAEGRVPRAARLRTAALLAMARGEPAQALGLWRDVLAVEPLALDAHRAVAQLLAESAGQEASVAHLRQACAAFPHNYALHQLLIEWLRQDGASATEPVVRHLVEIHPADAWARRELALSLSYQGRHDEAQQELAIACSLEPHSTAAFAVSGQVHERAGRHQEARTAYQQAIRRAVDNDFAIGRLMALCDSLAARREALAFLEEELIRQVTFGDGLLAYQRYAQGTLEPEELLALLRRALDERPDLWHAWSAVVRQLAEMNRHDEALEQARAATARFPLLPRLWLDLAAVCQARGDAAGEVAALQQALQINPGWSVTLRRLADAHGRAGRPDEMRAALERAVLREPLECANHGYLAEVLWQQGEREPALARMQQAVRLDPSYEAGWNALRAWGAELGQPQAAAELAREMTARRAGEARVWVTLARMLTRPEDLDERLAALDQAVRLHPHHAESYDLKAELLAGAGRFDEAHAACWAAVWEGQPPLFLRGRAAWVAAQRGNVGEAIRQMEALLAEDPDYYWGWANLADWTRTAGTSEQYLRAGNEMVRLAPGNAMAYGYRGEARSRLQDQAGARADFQKAFELDGSYMYAGLSLFDRQLADQDLDAARATLQRLEEQAPDDVYVLANAVRLQAKAGDVAAARKSLARLAGCATDDTWPLDAAVGALCDAGCAGDAAEVLDAALAAPEPAPQLGALWVRVQVVLGNWKCHTRLAEFLGRGTLGEQALFAYAHAVGDRKEDARRVGPFRKFLRRYQEALRASTLCWGGVGYALMGIPDGARTAAWMFDWAERSDAKPWMLINLNLGLRALGRDAVAAAVNRHALTLPADHTTPYHRLWLALDDVVAGQADAATTWLDGVDPARADATHAFLHELVQVVLDVLRAAPAERPARFASARSRLAEAVARPLPAEDVPALRQAHRRAVRRLAQDVGTWPAWFWSLWRRSQQVPRRPRG